MRRIKNCRSCGSTRLRPFFHLGKLPLANSLLPKRNSREAVYPLSLSFCADCRLVQLNETINPRLLFSTYPWVTGTSGVARRFAPRFARELLKRVPVKRPYVFELASNDGTFLAPFQKKGLRILGVDPARNVARLAREAGIPTRVEFFGASSAQRLVREGGRADAIIARNVLYHLAHLGGVMGGLYTLLAPRGVLAAEFHYGGKIQSELHYDAIYHEHLCYYTLASFEALLRRHGFSAFDIGESPINSGGLIVYAGKARRKASARLVRLRRKEALARVNEFEMWKRFAERVSRHREKFRALLRRLRAGASRVVGYGASARSSTLLNYSGVTTEQIAVIADQNPLKQGKYMAGNRIPVRSPEEVFAKDVGVVVLLAWNFHDEIRDILKRRYGFRGPYLLPLPGWPRVVGRSTKIKDRAK